MFFLGRPGGGSTMTIKASPGEITCNHCGKIFYPLKAQRTKDDEHATCPHCGEEVTLKKSYIEEYIKKRHW